LLQRLRVGGWGIRSWSAAFSMPSPRSSQYALGIGIGIGLILPPIARRLRRILSESSSTKVVEVSDDTTHVVRSGLRSSSAVRVPRSVLEDFVARCLVGAGADQSHAPLVAAVLVYADARGIPSHGVNRADHYANEIESGVVDGTAVPVVEKSSGCCAVVDGKNGLGAVVSELAMKTAINLAREHGVGFVVCHQSNHFGAAGFWAQRALEEGMMGMSFTNTSPFAVPTGGMTRAVGTNPFCCFAPAVHDDGASFAKLDSFQLDMATTVVPIGKIEVMDRIKKPVPAGWGVDRNGKNCHDAEEICKHGGLYPLGGPEETGGYKGYGLGMFVEIMCSILSGAAVGPHVEKWVPSREGAIRYGHCFVAVDPTRFASGYSERLVQYLDTMRSLEGNVQVPGDPEKAFEQDAAKNGVLLHGEVAASLKSLADKFGVEVPSVFASIDTASSRASLYK